MYLADGTGGSAPDTSHQVFKQVRQELDNSGLVVNEEKSCFSPKPVISSLGHIVDTSKNLIEASPS